MERNAKEINDRRQISKKSSQKEEGKKAQNKKRKDKTCSHNKKVLVTDILHRMKHSLKLDGLAIDGDFFTLTLSAGDLGNHHGAHPLDALIPTLDGKVMRLGAVGVEQGLLLPFLG